MNKALLLVTLLTIAASSGAGSGFSVEGNRLSAELDKHLIQAGHCRDFASCNEVATIYRRDGREIEFNLYSATNPEIVSVVFGFVAANGLRLTNGKPVVLSAFPKSKEEYVNSVKGFIANRKPVAQLRLQAQ